MGQREIFHWANYKKVWETSAIRLMESVRPGFYFFLKEKVFLPGIHIEGMSLPIALNMSGAGGCIIFLLAEAHGEHRREAGLIDFKKKKT